jgi:hypothetical protein
MNPALGTMIEAEMEPPFGELWSSTKVRKSSEGSFSRADSNDASARLLKS